MSELGHNPNRSLPLACPLPPGAGIWSERATPLVKLTYVAQGRSPLRHRNDIAGWHSLLFPFRPVVLRLIQEFG
jgi:hypothetical protein